MMAEHDHNPEPPKPDANTSRSRKTEITSRSEAVNPYADDPRPLLLALGELDQRERDELSRETHQDGRLSEEIETVDWHVRMHRALAPTAPKRGSFARLADRMHAEGHLGHTFPGSQCLWRRSFLFSLAAMAVAVILLYARDPSSGEHPIASEPEARAIGTLTWESTDASAEGQSTVEFGTVIATGDRSAVVGLPTGQRGVFTRLHFAPNTRFKLVSLAEVYVIEGRALSIDVKREAQYIDGFTARTPHGRVNTRGALFSLSIEPEASLVCVASGHLDARSENIAASQVVTSQFCTRLYPDRASDLPFDMLDLDILRRNDGQLRVTLRNRTDHRLALKRPGRPTQVYWRLRALDAAAELPESEAVGEFALLLTADTPDVGEASHDELELGVTGSSASSHSFNVDLRKAMAGAKHKEYQVLLRYAGPVQSDEFGTMEVDLYSQPVRITLEPQRDGG